LHHKIRELGLRIRGLQHKIRGRNTELAARNTKFAVCNTALAVLVARFEIPVMGTGSYVLRATSRVREAEACVMIPAIKAALLAVGSDLLGTDRLAASRRIELRESPPTTQRGQPRLLF